MKKGVAAVVGCSGAALCLLVTVVLAYRWTDLVGLQYPGSVALPSQGAEQPAALRFALQWQRTYLTHAELETVRAWYAARLAVTTGSALDPGVVDGCAWLTAARSMIVVSHTASVLACAVEAGTEVVVTESIRLGP